MRYHNRSSKSVIQTSLRIVIVLVYFRREADTCIYSRLLRKQLVDQTNMSS